MIALLVALATTAPVPNQSTPASDQVAAVCFKTGEQVSGMNKICYYDCLGSAVAITIGAVQLCPLSINN
ncbi:conserved protein of unknown function [Aminobacter niigataensis]|nr:conserved protein of unknown function [Aminobacter niigataensis]